MQNIWIAASLAVVALAPIDIGGHLAQKAARKIVSEVVEEGLEDAFREATLSATLDAVASDAASEFVSGGRDIHDYVEMGARASDGIDAAMRAANVAARLDDAADAAKAVKKLSKLKKLKR